MEIPQVNLQDRMLFAVPKKGRLNEKCMELLSRSDIQFTRNERLDIALVKNFPLALIFLPAADIPLYVSKGRAALGFTGRDQVAEYEAHTPPTETTGAVEIMDLGFGKCKLQVQVPKNGPIQKPEQLVGRSVATSFTHLTEAYFRDLEAKQSNGVNGQAQGKLRTDVETLNGSVESSCATGIAEGIVDLVESGTTMEAHGLKAIDTIVDSTAVLISSKSPSDPKLAARITERIKGVITAKKYVLCTYNIDRALLGRGTKITPGRAAPTITALDRDGWVAVQAMVEREKIGDVCIYLHPTNDMHAFITKNLTGTCAAVIETVLTSPQVMDELVDIGAKDILTTTVENSRAT